MCEFNPAKRHSSKHYILHPCSLSVNGSTPEGKGLHLSMQVTNIRLCVNPGIIELLNKAMSTLTAKDTADDNVVCTQPEYNSLWGTSSFDDNDYWFIRAEEAHDVLSIQITNTNENKEELCLCEIPSIILVIETGFGHQTIPMLVIETSMDAKINNWSWQMSIESTLRLSMSYYNSSLALWEPLIEPNESLTSGGLCEYVPWELLFKMEIDNHANESVTDNCPTNKISIKSKETLEMSVTKTCLDVLQSLGKAFSEAIKEEGLVKPAVEAPYLIENHTGFEITLNLTVGAFNLHPSHLPGNGIYLDDSTAKSIVFKAHDESADCIDSKDVTICKISPGGRAYLELKTASDSLALITTGGTCNEKFLHVKISDIDKEICLPVHRADERYFPLYRDTNQEPWAIVSQVKVEYGCTIITVHGILQVYNHFSAPISVHRNHKGVFHHIGDVPPYSKFNVPLHAIYAISKELHFSMNGYKESAQGISWQEAPGNFSLSKTLQCDPVKMYEPFYMNAIRERIEILNEVTSKYTMRSALYCVHLRPPLILKNTLPIGLRISVAGCSVAVKENDEKEIDTSTTVIGKKEDFLDYGEKLVNPGESIHLPTVKTSSKGGQSSSSIVTRVSFFFFFFNSDIKLI